MEFLFLNYSASIEAAILFISVLGTVALFWADIFAWGRRKFIALNPRKAYVLESTETVAVDTLPLVPEELVVESPPIAPPTESILLEDQDISGDVPETTPLDISSEIPEERESTPTEVADILPEIAEVDTTDTTPLSTIEDMTPTEELPEIESESIVTHTPTTAVQKDEVVPLEQKKKDIPPEKREKVIEIVNSVKTLIARGHIDEARELIVSGLAIDKDHRELNLLMAGIYEKDHSFEKAEYILKELAETHEGDTEILMRLATVLAMQRKYEVSYELYKKILSISGESEELLYTLAHLASEMALPEDIYLYSKSYLKQYPKNPEILWLYSQAQITRGERKEAIETLIKLKNLTPYNQEIIDLISKLVTEEELAGNFGEKTGSI